MKCVIYRCSKKQEMYLYLPAGSDDAVQLECLPAGLKKITGALVKVMDLDITPERTLARASAKDVLTGLEEKGFYIQMPPGELLKNDSTMLNTPSDSF